MPSGGDAARVISSVEKLVELQASQLEEVTPPLVSRAGKPLSAAAKNLNGVKAQQSQPALRQKRQMPTEEVAKQAEKLIPSVWAMRKRKLKGEPLSFMPREINARTMNRVRPFLETPLNDDSRDKGYRKARQIGLSENSVTESLWFADTKPHTKVFYTFPTNRQMQDFSNTRIAEAISESEHLQQVMGDIKNVNLKKVGTSFLFLRGSQSERLGEGVDADVAFFDEIDRMPPRVKVAFEESLQGSMYGWVREISTPTVPNHGIDESWNKSKQLYWFITCSRCRTKQTLEWLATDDFAGKTSVSLVDGVHVYACRKCDGELSFEDRIRGEWVPKFPRREPSYYQFNQLMAPWITAEKLWQKQEDYPFKQLFYNYCLGIPYLGDNVLVTEELIIGCRTIKPRDQWKGPRVLGIDWGDRSWMVVLQAFGDKIGIVHLERIDASDIGEIIPTVVQCFEKFDCRVMVNDAGYGKDRNTLLLKKFPERVYSCFYPTTEKGSKIFEPQWQDESHKVSVDRTSSIKLALGLFRSKSIVIAPEVDLGELKTFVKHLTNLVSVKDYDEKTGEIEEWIASTGQDHFGHAFNYAAIALGKLAKMPKSECWDWQTEVVKARQENAVRPGSAGSTSQPAVPGFMSVKDLIESTGGMGNVRPDKADCYSTRYNYDASVCSNCTLQRSCKSICESAERGD